MDVSADTALSLDELTVEFTDDSGLKQEIPFEYSGDESEHHIIKHDFCSLENHVFNDMDGDGGFITKEFVQNYGQEEISVGHTFTIKTNDGQERETTEQSVDSEDDTVILSFAKHPKVKDLTDSDSEFEVPDRPVVTLLDKADIEPVKHDTEILLSQTLTANQSTENNVFMDIPLTIAQSSPWQPAMIPSHDDFTTLSHQSSNTLPTHTADSTLLQLRINYPVSKSTIITTTNMYGGFVQDEERPSQDNFPKIDFPYNNQQHASEGSVKEPIPFVAPLTLEDGRSDTEGPLKPRFVTTAEDWDDIETVEPGYLQPTDKHRGPSLETESKPLAPFSDTWAHFAMSDYSSVKPQIKIQVERHGFSALKHMIFGPPRLHRDLIPQKELIFCLAATQFDNANEVHIRVLQTIYRCLTGSKFDCPRFGGHWEEIGFQGRDPATDLRGTGMLALLHLLYFLQSPQTKDLAKDVYKLSLHPTQNFPFCLMGINLSRISLQVLREDVFNKECNSNRDVPSTVNNVYSALFLHLYKEWKKGKTIVDSGFVLQEIEIYCRKHSKGVLRDLGLYEKTRKQQGLSPKDSDAEMIFYNVCKEDKTVGKFHVHKLSQIK